MSFKIVMPRAGYGYRIFVRASDVEKEDLGHLLESLSRMSKWGGPDKRDGEWIGFEFDLLGYTGAVLAMGTEIGDRAVVSTNYRDERYAYFEVELDKDSIMVCCDEKDVERVIV